MFFEKYTSFPLFLSPLFDSNTKHIVYTLLSNIKLIQLKTKNYPLKSSYIIKLTAYKKHIN